MHIHILGICGTFMGGLAALAHAAGHRVTGCDAGVYPPMSEQLSALGIDLIEGFGADQLALRPDMFVIGNLVSRARQPDGSPKFPLMEAILDAGQPYTSGPQWLAEQLLPGRHVLAVAGTHGKTGTSSMLAWILECAGQQPGFLIGGVPLNFGLSARLGAPQRPLPAPAPLGATPLFVIEADEYDTAFFDKRSKFVHYRPRTAVLNNLEFDHADIFADLAAIERQFHHLVRTMPASGRVVVNGLDASLARVLQMGCWSQVTRFGVDTMSAFGAEGTSAFGAETISAFGAEGPPQSFDVTHQGQKLARVEWALTGVHNQLNALAAIAAAQHVGVDPGQAAAALATFRNVKRRMELRGIVGGVAVYDDFAHHPSALRTTLDGLRRSLGAGARILAVFEPRSNTMKLGTMKSRLPWALEPADLAFCLTAGLDWDAAQALAPLGVGPGLRAQTAPDSATLLAQVTQAARPGDHVVCMSNGGFDAMPAKLLQALQKQ
ncbi:UDP-N-acetylmuramate:L-alanyl-gamma-D-glutamyl-meso-diaminopimelate ligase [Verminephrobacter eiseniae]|uniref:UDP-N-acetylmuramate--L-alanyl-gamma-D-glutamyl-meso-2,6-diaminoheptandioate ligase n=1 Tax=Verminephrobacter eiseniae (strain EF01-2) TaxID=391735 RepID=A1WHY9_VEREI|nr:UDP-N-acetylmuramate:L-alanyl-gamma-D-glutamyl-meso-diaminopimelate ligase [Verminephrobacter eiseniae]ABM57246.1 UDP-N-acetylmuramate [Verminephrobacter eiseniae EF01-2]MCW5282875.1 UDP-N-acetylmuramate:L-alanyl-gamma-D-glutamyl-meso-diaminopimelate ligase [Verminephrobacter eiseniae]MCW5303191.1 UDP-N-acetylmuramate:L-alanyl-gamma-D-glutamyl-meso-diaminopimelate ligase [Verminephrobacter eiseniae]MCW8179213.1 UDP-N-acetylmuramate:L-alanyl-gamma-D-glutamyl-meso-diaminopimelate ligase [Vermi